MGMVAVSTVSPGETMNWANQRADARNSMMTGKAQNLYNRQLSGLDFSKNVRDHNQRWDQTRLGIPSQYQQRGLLQSGLYKGALQEYGQQRMGAYTDMQQQYQTQMGQFTLNDRGFEDAYAQALHRILGEQYGRQATMASTVGGWA